MVQRLGAKGRDSADVVLSALLKAKYGKRAGDMRYRPAETVEIAEAMRAKLEASEAQQTAWLATMQAPSAIENIIAHEVSTVEGSHEYASSETAYGRTVGYDFAVKVF